MVLPNLVRGLVSALAVSFLSACSFSLPNSGEPPRLFVLTPKSTFPENVPAVDWQLLIEPPVSAAGLSTPRIALQDSPIELRYFQRANWTDFAPKMVQTLIIESFENSGRIVGVGREQIGLRSDFVLKSELREFQAEYTHPLPEEAATLSPSAPPPRIRVRLSAKLVKMPQREIVAARSFEAKIRAERNTMAAIIAAFDEALGKTLKALVIWTLKEGEAHVSATRRGRRRS